MAEVRILLDRLICLVCLDPLTVPVTTDCGHNFCMTCINEYWDQEDQRGVYSCPECTVKFTPRPNLRKNILLTEVSDSVKKTVQGASPAHRYAGLRRKVKEEQMKFEGRIQEKQEKVQELRQAVDTVKLSAQTAVEDNERLLIEMISSMEKMYSEVMELIIAQEKNELSRAERLLEQEITDLQRRVTELEQLSQIDDHLHFLQSFQSLHFSSGCDYSCRITANQDLSFDGVRKSLCDLKKRIEEVCQEEFTKIPQHAAAVQIILPSEPKSREDFLQYFCDLTLDPNSAYYHLILSETNREVMYSERRQNYSDLSERFDKRPQVLSKESVGGRCYWEVERRRDGVDISVSYKDISRKGRGNECKFGGNNQSWSLQCSGLYSLTFFHNNIETDLGVPAPSRIGVYLDHIAGTLSFYSVSDPMTLLHRVCTTFTQPLYAGIGLHYLFDTVRFCDP